MPLWLFIQVPLWAFGKSARWIENLLQKPLEYMEVKRKKSIFIIGSLWLLMFFLVAPSFSSFSLGAVVGNMLALGKITVGAMTLAMFVLAILDTIGDVSASRSILDSPMPGKNPVAGMDEAAAQGQQWAQNAGEIAEKGKKVKGVYDDIKATNATKAAKKSLWPQDVIKKAKGLKNLFTGISGGEAAAGGLGEAAAGSTAATVGATAGVGVAFIIVIAIVVFIIQLAVVTLYFFAIVEFFMPILGSAMFGALGLGEDYASWIGGELGDNVLAGTNINIDQHLAPIMEARQRVYCLLEGPACLRQWKLNNTQTPTSEEVGGTYRLELERFEVGSGDQLDIAYQNGHYSPPISFGLSNTRNGIYGINAYNVSYRIQVVDSSRSSIFGGVTDPYCQTGWRPVDGYSIRDEAESDSDEDSDDLSFTGNDLYPGTSAATSFMRLDDINLENCGFLQPGAGSTKTMVLEVKYDYYSEATLYFEAMARKVMQENPEVEKEWKPSETADTPVKSILNVNSPVLFQQDELGGENAAEPFNMRAALQTETADIRYKINRLEVEKSSEVKISDRERSCQFEPKEGDNDVLVPSGDAASILSDESEEARWYSSSNPPPFFGCLMELSNPAEINVEGQTLSMDVRSNYTVKLNQQLERLRVINSRCSTFNCPLLVTHQFVEERDKKDNWKTQCGGPDAGDGCVVVQGNPEDWSEIDLMTGDDLLDSKLEDDEYAYDPFDEGIVFEATADELKENISYNDDIGAAIGLNERQFNTLDSGSASAQGYAVLSVPQQAEGIQATRNPSREIVFEYLDTRVCDGSGNLLERYRRQTGGQPFAEYFVEDPSGGYYKPYVVVFNPLTGGESCSTESEQTETQSSDIPNVGSP